MIIVTLGKEGGISAHQIMDFETGLPVYRVNSYYHAVLRRRGIWTCTPGISISKQQEHVREAIQRLSLPEDHDEDW